MQNTGILLNQVGLEPQHTQLGKGYSDDDKVVIQCLRCYRSRKRGPSSSCDLGYGERDDQMNECNAALVLMSLSCSPNSPRPSKSHTTPHGTTWTQQPTHAKAYESSSTLISSTGSPSVLTFITTSVCYVILMLMPHKYRLYYTQSWPYVYVIPHRLLLNLTVDNNYKLTQNILSMFTSMTETFCYYILIKPSQL